MEGRRRDVQGRMGGRTARGRGTDRLLVRLRLARHVPRAASAVDRQARSAGVQADAGVGGLLARRPEERDAVRSEEHTSELQSLMRISYAVFCLKNIKHMKQKNT